MGNNTLLRMKSIKKSILLGKLSRPLRGLKAQGWWQAQHSTLTIEYRAGKGAVKPMTKLTKQHFQAVAQIIATQIEHAGNECCISQLEWLATALADYLATTNTLFDYARFIQVCGIRRVKV